MSHTTEKKIHWVRVADDNMSYGKYKEIVLRNFSGGLNTKFDAADLDIHETPDIQNMVFNGRNSIQPRRGSEVFIASAAGDGIANTHSFKDRKGTEHVMLTSATDVKYLNTYTSAFEDLKGGIFTADQKFGFDYYGSASLDDFTYFCNGIEQMWAWHPRYHQLSGTHASSATTVYVSTSEALSALGWLSAGSFVADGEEAYYTGLTNNTFTGVTRVSNAGSLTTQKAVAQLPISTDYTFTYDGVSNEYSLSGHPKCNIVQMFQSRMMMAGVSTAEETVHYSMLDNPWDITFTAVSAFTAGMGGIFSFSEGGGPITGLAAKDDGLIVFKEDIVRGLRFTDADIPYPITVIDGLNLGAITSKAIVPVESDIFFASPIGAVRSLQRSDEGGSYKLTQMAQKIEPTLNNMVMTSAAATYHNQKWYLACATSGAAFNNTVLMYDYIYNGWTQFAGWNVNDWFIYDKELHYGASNEDSTYRCLQSFSDNTYGYESFYKTKKLDYDIPHELKRLRYVYLEGLITTNTDITVELYYNEEDAPITKTILGSGTYVNVTGEAEEIGKSTFGKGTLGGEDSDESYLLYKFRVRLSYDNVDFFNMQMKFKTDTAGDVWKINKVVPYVQPIPGKKFPVDSII